MKLVRPIRIDDAALVSSNIPETAPAAWSGATTYAADALVSVAGSGTVLNVYRSLQASNLNHNPASSPTWWEPEASTYKVYSSGTPYAVDDIVISVSADYHHAFQALQAGSGHPLTDTNYWLDLGATNRWRMFDDIVQSPTEAPDSIEVSFTAAGRADSVVLLNVAAITATVRMYDSIDGYVYDTDFSLVSNSGIQDWYAYFFEPIERVSDLVVTDMPPYANARIDIILSAPGETVQCGECIPGLSKEIGETQAGASIGIRDFSLKEQDAFGNFSVLQRAFSRRATFTVWVDAAYVDQLVTLLASYRATPIVYLGDEGYRSTAVFGFFKDFNVEIAYPEHSLCSLDVEGLT